MTTKDKDVCPACKDQRIHVAEEWKKYHPFAGTGIDELGGKPIAKEREKNG